LSDGRRRVGLTGIGVPLALDVSGSYRRHGAAAPAVEAGYEHRHTPPVVAILIAQRDREVVLL